jgi:hypothetical protein
MKRRRAVTVEDFFSAPEGEWFYDPEGRELEILDDTTAGIDTPLRVPVAKTTAVRLRLRPGERFTAQYIRGALFIKRVTRRRARRSP